MRFHKKSSLGACLLLGLILAGCSSPDEKEAKYLKRGNELFSQGEYEKARIEYKNASRIKPTDPEVMFRVGLVDEAEGNLRGAFADFSHSEEQNAHFRPALLKLAEYYIVKQQNEQAQQRVDIVLTDTPNDPEGHALKAAILMRRKEFSEAEKEARFALAQDPASVSGYSVLTGIYNNKGDMVQAEKTIEEGISKNPQSVSLLLLKANINEHSHDLAKVAEAYQELFKLKPKERHFRYDLANIYIHADKLDDAENALRTGVAALPDDWEMKHQLVDFLGAHRSVEAAEKEIRGYMQSNPEHDELYSWLIDLYVRHNSIDRAVAFLDQIISKNQFNKEGLNARTAMARINYIQGKKDAAEQLMKLVLEKDPNNLDAIFMRATLAFDRAAYQDAASDLHTIVREKPHSKDALRLLAETMMAQGHMDLAIDTMNQIMELDPTDPNAKIRLAQLYHLNGDSKHAMDLLYTVTKMTPQYPLVWESTARIAIDIKDWPTALRAVDTLDTFDGQHITAAFLRGEVMGQTGKEEEAIAQYVKIINAEPTSSLAELSLKALVGTYRKMNKLEEAARYMESFKTRTTTANTILGQCYLDLNKPDQAATAFDAAIAGSPNNPEPYLYRAKISLDHHKDDEAIAMLKRASAAFPNDVRADMLEAQTLGKQGKYQDAITLYGNLIAHNPQLDVAANNMAELIADYEYSDPAELEKARQVAERFVASPNPLLLDTLAWIYYRQGKLQEAQTAMERVVTPDAKQLPPEVHYHYGAILAKAGKTKEAKAELQQATATTDIYPGLEDAKKMLAAMP